MDESGRETGHYDLKEEIPDRAVNTNEVEVAMKGRVDNNKTSLAESEPNVKVMKAVGMFDIFRYSDKLDKLLMFLATLFMMTMGSGLPINLYFYGDLLNKLVAHDMRSKMNASMIPPELQTDPGYSIFKDATEETVSFAFLGLGALVTGGLGMFLWIITAERQIFRIRRLFFRSLMRQTIGWYDEQQVGDLASRLSEDINNIHAGMGDKLATFIQWNTTFFGGIILALVQGWKLTLVIMSITPLLIISTTASLRFVQKMTINEGKAYGQAGSIAEEVLSAIRTVAAFGSQKQEIERFSAHLDDARRLGVKKSTIGGALQGLIFFVFFSGFSIALWYGSKLVNDGEYQGGQVIQVLIGVMVGSFSLGQAGPFLGVYSSAKGAAAKIFDVIENIPEIDSSSDSGEKPQNCEGNIRLESVEFAYPSRREVPVLQGLSIDIRVGQTVALVGPSGCGKSTVVQLIQRFYDPHAGKVLVDGKDVSGLNVSWLRGQIGVVSQEPVLFATTIEENIRYGRMGVTEAEIVTATKESNAHDFISKLPLGYKTLVGERGVQLSGGQKQRIAIARALVRNPKILLLDEATSALDNQSEAVVQEALDKASKGRTTVVIAHRLSTIKNADIIYGIRDGQVAESGTHENLMEKHGLYYELVMNQTKTIDGEGEKVVEPDSFHDVQLNAIAEPIRFSSLRGSKTGKSRIRTESIALSDKDEAEEEEMKNVPNPTKRIMRMNADAWPYVLLGCVCSILLGCTHPTLGVLISVLIGNFGEPDSNEQIARATRYAGLFVGLGALAFLGHLGANWGFGVSGERVTMKLRHSSFAAMLKQDMSWFDDPKNGIGVLTSKLATDASDVKGVAGPQLGLAMNTLGTLVTALVIAFIEGWKLAFVVSGFVPLMIASGVVQGRMFRGFAKHSKEKQDEASKAATEAMQNIRTVASLGREDTFVGIYEQTFREVLEKGKKSAIVFGLSFGITQSLLFFNYAVTFTFGSWLIEREEIDFTSMFRVYVVITFGSMQLGRASVMVPDYVKAKIAAARIFTLLDSEPTIDVSSDGGKTPANCEGTLEFSSVKFRYPMRKDVTVLKGINLEVKQGQTVALVGSSGCGKSTTIQLIERFYDAESGVLKLDGNSTKELNIQWLRRQIGLVSQEPVLFGLSIKENIAYGDTSRDVPMEEIIEAAKQANIHGFIKELPLGYDTHVGEKGAQLSGGQKQRIAIARALVRNPKVLLLDEATSALDTESEKVVQEALDRAREGRTSVVIAHRLSTIQNADQIIVIHNGVVIEAGTHSQLLAAQGQYYKLHFAQHKTKSST